MVLRMNALQPRCSRTAPPSCCSQARVTAQANKRLSYAQFLEALRYCADARGVDVPVLHERIANCDGPIVHATQADNVRFHDDRILPVERKSAASGGAPAKGRPQWQDK